MIRFGPFQIDPRTWTLSREGDTIDLSPRLVEILGYLVARGGAIVTKDELLERFWPGVNITDNTLTRAIADIRKAIGDHASDPQYVQTAARRGYRFAGSTGSTGSTGSAGSAGSAGSTGSTGPSEDLSRRSAPDDSRANADLSRRSSPDDSRAEADPFKAWVKGRLALESLDVNRLAEAVTAFERAAAELPSYAPAHAGLANAYLLQFERTRFGAAPDRDLLERAIAAARRARELDGSLGEAWATLGYLLCATGAMEEAQAAARRACALEPENWRHQYRLAYCTWGEERLRAVTRTLALMPGFAPARMLSAMVFIARGALDRAEREAELGAELQREHRTARTPLPAVGLHWLLGLVRAARGDVASALASFEEEIDGGSSHIYAREFVVNARVALAFVRLSQHDIEAAGRALSSALADAPGHPKAAAGAYIVALHGGEARAIDAAKEQFDRIVSDLARDGRRVDLALVNAGVSGGNGQLERAVSILDELLSQAPPGSAGWIIPVDPMLAGLRAAPRFDALLHRLAARAV